MEHEEALTSLGNTAEEIRAALNAKGITGDKGALTCPIANYLRSIGVKHPSVGSTEYGVVYGGMDSYKLSLALQEFVRNFDNGDYPEMKEQP